MIRSLLVSGNGEDAGGASMNGEPIQVLLVESTASGGPRLEQQLEQAGVAHIALERAGPEEAIGRLEKNHIDIVLLDLPYAEAIRALPRVQERAPSLPVIVLSDDED